MDAQPPKTPPRAPEVARVAPGAPARKPRFEDLHRNLQPLRLFPMNDNDANNRRVDNWRCQPKEFQGRE